MNHSITAASTYIDDLLSRYAHGTVHSVYNKTINIQAKGQLFALQSAYSPLSPVSLITDLDAQDMESLAAAPGQAVRISRDRIMIHSLGQSIVFDYKPADIYCSRLAPLYLEYSVTDLAARVKSAVSGSNAGAFRLVFSESAKGREHGGLILNAARKHMAGCTSLFRDKSYEEAARLLTGLTGLGIGLTPSGDDFLCGVLAGLILCGRQSHPFSRCLSRHISGHTSDTNDISRAFLCCAVLGQFSQAVTHLSGLPSAEEILRIFESIGHTSGIDTLCGILYALELDFHE